MAVKFSNNGKTTLASNITSSATSISVTDGSVFPTLSGGDTFFMTLEDLSGNIEIVSVTARSGNTLTVTRAQEGTTARAFSSPDKAENRLTAAGLNSFVSDSGDTLTGNLSFGDNDKAIFGAGSDLEIYHDGSNSIVKDAGTGSLELQGSSWVILKGATSGNWGLASLDGAQTNLYHNGSLKLGTTATGIDVTGTVTADGLTVSDENYANPVFSATNTSTGGYGAYINTSGFASSHYALRVDRNSGKQALRVDGTGDISFYNSAGTSQSLFWDASAESLLSGATSLNAGTPLAINGVGTNNGGLVHAIGAWNNSTQTAGAAVRIDLSALGNTGRYSYVEAGIEGTTTGHYLSFGTNAAGANPSERLRIDSSGNVGINTSSPQTLLDISHQRSGTRPTLSAGTFLIVESSANPGAFVGATILGGHLTGASILNLGDVNDEDVGQVSYHHSDNSMRFKTNATERMRIDSSGNVLVGQSSTAVPGLSNTTTGLSLTNNGYIFASKADDNVAWFNRNTSDGSIISLRKDGTTVGSIGTASGYSYWAAPANFSLMLVTNDIRPRSVTGSTNNDNFVDIGTSAARFKDLHLGGTAYAGGLDINISTNARGYFADNIGEVGSGNFALQVVNAAGSALKPLGFRAEDIRFATGSSERMRLDSSGNLLVGRTSTSTSVAGVTIPASGAIQATANFNPLGLNRLSGDGNIAVFQKSGTTVGSIGSITSGGSQLRIGDTSTGLCFRDDQVAIVPANSTSLVNNTTDLGNSLYRFKDLHLSGTAYAGGVDITSGTATGLIIDHDVFGEALKIVRNHASTAPSITWENSSGRIGILYANDGDNNLKWRPGTGATDYGIWHSGNDGSGSGLDADTLDGMHKSAELGPSAVGNFGQWQPHTTYTDFNSNVAYWGWNFVKGNTNAPNTTATQWYRNRVSLGDQYGFQNGSGDYWLEMAYPRNSTSAGGLFIRSCEGGSIGGWFEAASKIANNTTWHSGNDGSGSGLDADTVDGVHASSFLRSDVADTSTGKITFNGGLEAQAIFLNGAQNFDTFKTSGFYSLYNVSAAGNTNAPFQYGAMITAGNTANGGGMAMQIAHERTGAGTYIRGMNDSNDTWYAWKEIWTSGTDGSGSGLDADTVDGVQANRIPYALNGSFGSTNTDTAAGQIGANNITRSMFYRDNGSNFGTIGFHSQHATNGGYAWQMASTSYTDASQIQARVKNNGTWTSPVTIWNSGNDGASSGLDADTVDGLQASQFVRSDANDTLSGTYLFNRTTTDPAIDISGHAGASSYNYFLRARNDGGNRAVMFVNGSTRTADGGPNAVTIRNDGGPLVLGHASNSTKLIGTGDLTYNGNEIWHAGNDGSGSGLDADTVDGLQASQFLRSDVADTAVKLNFGVGGVQAPTSSDATTGARLNLYPIGSGRDYTIGIGPNTMWFNSDDNYKWYVDGSLKFEWDNAVSQFEIGGNKVWHAGNDGGGSGLDADLLDGIDSLSFKRNDQTGVTAEFSNWYTTPSHNYANSVSTYYWVHLGTMGGNSKGSIEYEFKTDENYPHFVKGTIAFSSFSGGTSFSVQHDQHSPDRFAVQVRLDTSRRIWIRAAGVAWSHYFRFRTHHATGTFTTNTSFTVGTGRLTSTPANSSGNINGGNNLRATNTSVTGSIPTYNDNYHRFSNILAHYNVSIGGNTAWHAGNDGSGSGLDADNLDGLTWTSSGKNVRATQFYADDWFRNYNSGEGIYNEGTGQHFYSDDDDYWNIAGGGTANGLRFRDDHNSTIRGTVYSDNSSQIGFLNSSGNWSLKCDNSGNVTATGNVTAYSDVRLKTDIEPIKGALDRVNSLEGVEYTRKSTGEREMGFIAQEVISHEPTLVDVIDASTTEQDAFSDLHVMKYQNTTALLVEAIKELKTEVDDLKTQLAEKG